jgi:hypothetical protein
MMLAPVIFVLGGNLQDGLLSCPQNLRGMRQQSKKKKDYLGHLLLFVYVIFVNYRKRMQKIIPSKLIAGSGETAFDDVNSDDPDFLYIQCK